MTERPDPAYDEAMRRRCLETMDPLLIENTLKNLAANLERALGRVAELEQQRRAVLGFLDDVNREEWASKVLISTAIRSAYGLEPDSWTGA